LKRFYLCLSNKTAFSIRDPTNINAKTISKRYDIKNLENFNFSIFFYLIEKKLYYLNLLSDEKLVESMTKKYLNQATFLNNEINKLLDISK